MGIIHSLGPLFMERVRGCSYSCQVVSGMDRAICDLVTPLPDLGGVEGEAISPFSGQFIEF